VRTVSELKVARRDIEKIVLALHASQKPLAGIRMMTRDRTTNVLDCTLIGDSWTVYVTMIVEREGGPSSAIRPQVAADIRLFGDEDRFIEDFILAKMALL
jgi:hypothetical protein